MSVSTIGKQLFPVKVTTELSLAAFRKRKKEIKQIMSGGREYCVPRTPHSMRVMLGVFGRSNKTVCRPVEVYTCCGDKIELYKVNGIQISVVYEKGLLKLCFSRGLGKWLKFAVIYKMLLLDKRTKVVVATYGVVPRRLYIVCDVWGRFIEKQIVGSFALWAKKRPELVRLRLREKERMVRMGG